MICFEWLQRPEKVLAGYVSWNGYRGKSGPTQIRIDHHKTGEMAFGKRPWARSPPCFTRKPRRSYRGCRDLPVKWRNF